MADDPPPPILQLTPLNPDFRDDPHAILRRLRDAHPVYRDEMAGSNVITRYKPEFDTSPPFLVHAERWPP